MRKQIIAFIAGALVLFNAASLLAFEGNGGDDWVIPLDSPLPFPWNSIEGIWKVDSPKFQALYSFEVQFDCDNRKILTVLQLDPTSREVVAKGIGYMNGSTREVRAAMSALSGGSYLLSVGAYNDKSTFPYRSFIALRVSSFTDWSRIATFRIYKVEPDAVQLGPPKPNKTVCPPILEGQGPF